MDATELLPTRSLVRSLGRFKVNGLSSSNPTRSKNKFIGNYFEAKRRAGSTGCAGTLDDHREGNRLLARIFRRL